MSDLKKNNSTIRIAGAHKFYHRGRSNEIHVMDNINLELPESGMIAVFGKSGCGKTTLLNAIGGLDRIAAGSIEIFGQNIRQDTDTLRNKYIGYIFQNYNLNVADTVYENVAAALRLCGMNDESVISDRVMAALRNVGMDKYSGRTPDTLSGGQQQRVAIARALVKNPAIILADEPTGNLDENNTVMVMDILKEISKTHLVLLVTHEANLVDYYCDRVIEIVDGRIQSQRENENANGYIQRNKNHIYLGELERSETATPGVKVEYYGEPSKDITLRIVHVDGKLYLQTDDPSVKILDEGSEIQLREGVFQDRPTPDQTEGTHNEHHLDMSHLTPLEGKNFGRLFHWKNAFVSAWRENFSQKQKKGKRLLRVCLIMLAVVMVFMTALIGANIRSYFDLREDHNQNMIYLPIDLEKDYSTVTNSVGKNGIEYYRIVSDGYAAIYEELSVNPSAFMTADTPALTVKAYMQDVAHMGNVSVVAGTDKMSSATDMIITTAVADKLIENSTVGYIDEPQDLVGLVSANPFASQNLRIVGVIESDELFFYMDSLTFARVAIQRQLYNPAIIYASDTDYKDTVKPGEMIYMDTHGESRHKVGDEIQFLGKTFTVAKVVGNGAYIMPYEEFVEENYQEKIPAQAENEPYYQWLLEDYDKHMPAYYQYVLETRSPYDHISYEEWAIAEKQSVVALAQLVGYDPYEICGAYLFHQENGRYPTDVELKEYRSIPETDMAIVDMLNEQDRYWKEYDLFIQERNEKANEMEYQNNRYDYIFHDEDYKSLAIAVGKSENIEWIYIPYEVYDWGSELYYTHYLQIHTSDPEVTASYLADEFGDGFVITPDEIFEENLREVRSLVIIGAVGILVVLAFMCLCVFFIMRSSFMSRVREVGILRAIGVTRRNLVFRFSVESALLILLTLGLGYLASSWFIASLSGAALFSTLFYFPVWLAGGLFAVICAVALFFGILPALLLLHKTPSEILSKYDI